MENASKALLIAGAILIVIILISVGLLVIQSTGTVQDRVKTDAETIAIRTFNSQFIYYERDGNSASTVKSLMNTIKASNNKNPNHEVKLFWDSDEEKEVMSNEISAQNTYKISVEYNKDGYIHRAYLSTSRKPKPTPVPEPEPTPDEPEGVTATIKKHTSSTLGNNILFVVDASESMGTTDEAIIEMTKNTIYNLNVGNYQIKVALFSSAYTLSSGGSSCNCPIIGYTTVTSDDGTSYEVPIREHTSNCISATPTTKIDGYYVIDAKDISGLRGKWNRLKGSGKTDFTLITTTIDKATEETEGKWSVIIASDFYDFDYYSDITDRKMNLWDTNIYKNGNLEKVILVRFPITNPDGALKCDEVLKQMKGNIENNCNNISCLQTQFSNDDINKIDRIHLCLCRHYKINRKDNR